MNRRGLKEIIKDRFAWLLLRLGGAERPSRRSWPVMLHYHRIDGCSFETQVRYLSEQCRIVPFDQVVKYVREGADVAPGSVVVTFDDGYRSMFSEVYPILQRYQVPATVFLLSGLIDTERATWFDLVEWVIYGAEGDLNDALPDGLQRFVVIDDAVATRRELLMYLRSCRAEVREHYVAEMIERSDKADQPVPEPYRLLAWDQVREMDESGLVTFGGHTRTHPILSRVGMSRARSEILGDKSAIERELGHSISDFAYPNGKASDLSAETIRVLARAGYHSAVTTIPGLCGRGTDPYLLPRWGISSEDSGFTFAAKARGLWPPWRRA